MDSTTNAGAPTPAACECGHKHETVTLDGTTSVFHRCRVRLCECREYRPATPVPPSSGGEPLERYAHSLLHLADMQHKGFTPDIDEAKGWADAARAAVDAEIAALRERVEAAERALASLAKAATRVNDRYIGGSRLNGPLGGAIEKLAEANAPALALLRATPTETSDAE